jgi:hypothetical protein
MLLNQSERGSKPRRAQPVVLRDTYLRIELELGLARLVMNVNVHPRLFPREEVEAVPSRTKDRGAHRIILPQADAPPLARRHLGTVTK